MPGETETDRILHAILFERRHDKETLNLKATICPTHITYLSNKFDDDNDDHDDDV